MSQLGSSDMSSSTVLAVPSKVERVEIDTSLPFASVKAAVSLFGEKVDSQKAKSQELAPRRPFKDVDLLQAKQELANVQQQLAIEEKRKERALSELAEARKLLEHMAEKVKASETSGVSSGQGSNGAPSDDNMDDSVVGIQEKHVVWETQSNVQDEQSNFESAKQSLSELKSELLSCVKERDSTLNSTQEVLSTLQVRTQRADNLTKELGGLNESLVLLKLACIEANREKIALLEAKQTDKAPLSRTGHDLQLANEELRKAELEHKLAEAMKQLGELQAEMASKREAEVKATAITKDTISTLDGIKLDLERTRMSDESATTSLESLCVELEEAKAIMKKELDNAAELSAILESLKNESETLKTELNSVKQREANATAAASVLTGELARIRSELETAVAAETRASESISGLFQAFEQVKAELEDAKSKAEMLNNEASQVRKDADEAKRLKENAENDLQKALHEANEAKIAEAAAVDRVKSLSVKTYATRASSVEPGAEIIISNDEYDSLKRKVQEAEELANMRVAAAIAQVEAVKASEEEILQKLAMAIEEIEDIKSATKQALDRTDMAVAAKSAVENELKRLRDREQKRRVKSDVTRTSQQYSMKHIDEGRQSSYRVTPPTSGPLGDLMSQNPEEIGKVDDVDRNDAQKKKKPILNTIGSYLSKRKSFSPKEV